MFQCSRRARGDPSCADAAALPVICDRFGPELIRHARTFFEPLVADNLDLGRPDQIEIIFGRRIAGRPPLP
ncbi:MAG TPA: hypothetical protein VFQ77_14335 [Pseudonocardiaceae bacterium]|nr:hypothetical protein [Pseudonocardiaceae bacterium]